MTQPELPPAPTIVENAPRQATRFDFFAGTAEGTFTSPSGKYVYGRRQVSGRPDLIYWWLEIRSVQGGLGVTYGDWDWAYDRTASEVGIDARFPRRLILAQQTATQTSPDPTGDLQGLHHANIFDTMFVGTGSGNDVSLYKETSATDPTLTAITGAGTAGRPGSAITFMAPTVINNTQYLAIGRTSAVPMLMSDANGTMITTLDSSLSPCYGLVFTPINDRTTLWLANDRIRRTVASGAVAQTPTIAEAVSWPNGGYALGSMQLDGGPWRAFWGLPYTAVTKGVLLFGTEILHRVVSCNWEGSDQQDHDLGFRVGVAQAALVPAHGAIIGHDHEQMRVLRKGHEPVPAFVDRIADSDREYRIRNMVVNANEVVYEVNFRASPSGTGATVRHWESYDLNTGAVHQISEDQTLSSTGSYGILSPGSSPFSRYTRFLHSYSDGAWRRVYLPRYGEDPYAFLRQTDSAQSGTGNAFAASGTVKLPFDELPDLEGLPKTIKRITCLGDIQSAGTASTAGYVTVTCANTPVATFYPTVGRNVAQVFRLYDNKSTFYQLQVQIDLVRTTNSTKFTPQPLPIRIEGLAYRNVDEERRMLDDESAVMAMFAEAR